VWQNPHSCLLNWNSIPLNPEISQTLKDDAGRRSWTSERLIRSYDHEKVSIFLFLGSRHEYYWIFDSFKLE
jgi:hypothetical protein